MAAIIVIPIIVVAILGLAGFLIYRYVIMDMSSRRTVHKTFRQYDIDMTPSQIIREYYRMRGQTLSEREISGLEKEYMHREPDRFLAMYDAIRARPPRSGNTRNGNDPNNTRNDGYTGGSDSDK